MSEALQLQRRAMFEGQTPNLIYSRFNRTTGPECQNAKMSTAMTGQIQSSRFGMSPRDMVRPTFDFAKVICPTAWLEEDRLPRRKRRNFIINMDQDLAL